MTVIELYERLLEKGYKPNPHAEQIYSLYSQAGEATRSVCEDCMKVNLEIDYPQVFCCYYSGIANKRKRCKDWSAVMFEAMKCFYETKSIKSMTDYILQNP